MLGTNKKVVLKKLVFVTSMLIGVLSLTGCTIKDVVVDMSQKDQIKLTYYDCDKNRVEKDDYILNGPIKKNGSMCIPGIFLAKDVPEFKNLTVNDLKIIMDAPVVYTNGTIDPSDNRVVTFTSPGNDVYAFTQEGLNAYNATGNETIQFDYKLKYECLDPNKPFKIYSYFGIKKIFVNNNEVKNYENTARLYDTNGSKLNDIDFDMYYATKGKNTITVVDFLGRKKEVSFNYDTYKPKYEKGNFMGYKWISIYSLKSNAKYIKINGKKINLKKKTIKKKTYTYEYFKDDIGYKFMIHKNSKKSKKKIKIEIKYKNGYLFKYKL